MSAPGILASLLPWLLAVVCAGAAVGEKLVTMAYVMDRESFGEVASDALMVGGKKPDPFAEKKPPDPSLPKAVAMEKPPGETRFLKDGDRMWSLTKQLRGAKVLRDEGSWVVWSETTLRLVVHGSVWEQGMVTGLLSGLGQPLHIVTTVRLLEVSCPEIGAVSWSPEEIEKRGSKILASVSQTLLPGLEASKTEAMDGGEASVTAVVGLDRYDSNVNVRFECDAPVKHRKGMRKVQLETSVVVMAGREVFIEIGGADDAGVSHVIGVLAVPNFADGTPVMMWREGEDEIADNAVAGIWRGRHMRIIQDDGLMLMRFSVPPVFGGGIGTDHVAPREPRMKPPKELGWALTKTVLDLSGMLKEHGVEVPEGGWAILNEGASVVSAKLDEVNMDRLEDFVRDRMTSNPRLLGVTASVIEWDGQFEAGKIPTGARRLARVGSMVLFGRKGLMQHEWPGGGRKRGISFVFDPKLGKYWGDPIAEQSVELELTGEHPMRLSTEVVMESGQPLVVPVRGTGGTMTGVVFEVRMTDAAGRDWERVNPAEAE